MMVEVFSTIFFLYQLVYKCLFLLKIATSDYLFYKRTNYMELLIFLKVFLFVLSLEVIAADLLYVIITFILKDGKIIPSVLSLVIFGIALAYVIAYLVV